MNMSKYITPVFTAAALLASVNARAQVELAEGLTATGFIDMSVLVTDTDGDSTTSLGLDQWEIDFLYDFGDGVTAQVDLNDTGDGAEVEQAFIVGDLGGGFSAKAGLFLTPLGYEGAEPIYLWQYSVSATIIGYPGYANGAALMYANDLVSLYAAVVDGSYSADEDGDEVSIEGQIKLFPVEGLTLQLGYASEKFEGTPATDDAPATESYDQGIINFWVEYAVGALTVAAEYNSLMEMGGADADGDGYLVMANYAITDKLSLTVRHSGVELDTGYENTEFTISPSYVFTDHLFGLLEFRTDDFDDDSLDGESYAAELVYTF